VAILPSMKTSVVIFRCTAWYWGMHNGPINDPVTRDLMASNRNSKKINCKVKLCIAGQRGDDQSQVR
jgi:hypothetical protein